MKTMSPFSSLVPGSTYHSTTDDAFLRSIASTLASNALPARSCQVLMSTPIAASLLHTARIPLNLNLDVCLEEKKYLTNIKMVSWPATIMPNTKSTSSGRSRNFENPIASMASLILPFHSGDVVLGSEMQMWALST
eukprot:gnl/TRDRNA2_/TRDRNA2_147810_c0_seq1.p2 gnl/TRDRNA2_/TRDRNA2_147810_c0~~gnl/TRDRNA2_/TRDRNA2_147810_c0_seq1.p2  ORF type:complete len:136 (-),score=6.66 gnl/TRDRNA2_/TRDRNA2_147810_c0_seq1:58-465(-)